MNRRTAILSMGMALVAVTAVAQQSSDGPYVLHEFFEGDIQPGAGSAGAAGAAGARDPKVPGAPPTLSMEQRNDELVYGADGPLADARLQAPYGDLSPFGAPNPLDSNTDRVDDLNYFASFDPSVIPYKRVVAQNRVRRSLAGRYEAYLDPGDRRAVDSTLPAQSTTFWGTFMFRSEPRRFMPVASVSPDQVVLDVRTEPQVPVEVLVDEAGNFMLRSDHQGLLRVNMEVAVPEFYFTGDMDGLDWSAFEGRSVSGLDVKSREVAQKVMRQIGIDRNTQRPGEVVTAMVEYFRNFEGRPFPEELDTGDLYESIAMNQIGVCRHRSLAFVITAQALGIRAHYVYNEAHAFVEVFWPDRGWRRIDLGGAADQMNATAEDGRQVHGAQDTLPQPKRFLDEQERMVQNGWNPNQGGNAGGNDATNSNTNGNTNGGGATNGAGSDVATDVSDAPAPAADRRVMPVLRFMRATQSVKRGGVVSILGRLTDRAGQPLAGREIEIHLGSVGSKSPSGATLVSKSRSSAQGWIIDDVAIPEGHAIGRWSMFLYFPGDETYRAVAAE